MNKTAIALIAALSCTPALGADLAYKTAPPPVQIYNWTGFYIGGNAGYGWGRNDTSNNSITSSGPIGGLPVGAFPLTTFLGEGRSVNADGGFGGGQIGYNWQTGNIVFGFEADFQWSDFKGTDHYLTPPALGGPGTDNVHSGKMDMFGTARARLGIAQNNWMFYGTGGLAYGHADINVFVQPGTIAAPVGPSFSASDSKWVTGYAVGAGIEWAFAPNWSIKAEYLHLGFGNQDYAFNFGGTEAAATRLKFDLDLVRGGVNYRF